MFDKKQLDTDDVVLTALKTEPQRESKPAAAYHLRPSRLKEKATNAISGKDQVSKPTNILTGTYWNGCGTPRSHCLSQQIVSNVHQHVDVTIVDPVAQAQRSLHALPIVNLLLESPRNNVKVPRQAKIIRIFCVIFVILGLSCDTNYDVVCLSFSACLSLIFYYAGDAAKFQMIKSLALLRY